MPDLAQAVIPNIARFGVVFGLYPLCFKVFAWVKDRLSINAKAEISAWLKSTGNFAANQIFSFNLSRFHSQLFGDKQFSWKCVKRTMLFSFISFIVVFFPVFAELASFILKNDGSKIIVPSGTSKTVVGD